MQNSGDADEPAEAIVDTLHILDRGGHVHFPDPQLFTARCRCLCSCSVVLIIDNLWRNPSDLRLIVFALSFQPCCDSIAFALINVCVLEIGI